MGIGTSEVEHVLATQCLVWSEPRTMEASLSGAPGPGVTAKDLILALIGAIGTAGAAGHVIEYAGDAIRALSMEERMTVCNMSIEAGARAGMIAPDDTTFAYLAGRPRAPRGAAWDRAVAAWRGLQSDPGATYDRRVTLDAARVPPQVTWGTSPGMVTGVTGAVPDPADCPTDDERRAVSRALEYMDLAPGTPLAGLPIDRVFLGSCTNGRIEDLRAAARVVRGRRVASGVRAMVVPGSQLVRAQAEREGLDRVFREAGFEWRNAGCSMCLGMNADTLKAGERCASTSNRNFEGRQGRGHSAGRGELRVRLIAGARSVGARRVRLPCDPRAVVRRHLLRKLLPERSPGGAPFIRGDRRAAAPPRGRGRSLPAVDRSGGAARGRRRGVRRCVRDRGISPGDAAARPR